MAGRSEPQYAAIDVSSLGDNTIVAAVAGRSIRVIAAFLVASGGVNTVRLESGAGGTALTGPMNLGADGQLVLPINGFGWFETDVGAILNLELSAATSVAGALVYEEVEG